MNYFGLIRRVSKVKIIIGTVIITFALGYLTSTLLTETRVKAEAGDRFREFIIIANNLGIISHEKIAEMHADLTKGEKGATNCLQ